MINSRKQTSLKIGEPNLIPLLDFMLVLIVMFVLLAGPMREAVQIPLPEVKAGAARPLSKPLPTIKVVSAAEIYLDQEHFTSLVQLENYLKQKAPNSINEVVIAIDKSLEVNTLLKLFAMNKTLGITTTNIEVTKEADL